MTLLGWRKSNQPDATNLMFIIKLLSQHVSGIIMPIIRRTRMCTAAYVFLHWLWWLWLCGAGTRAVCTVKVTVRTVTFISTCFWHHYAFHQENKTVHCLIWCSALVVIVVVVWSWDASCVHCESYCSNSNFYLNMFLASLCSSSGEHECALPHMVFFTGCDGCGCVELGRDLCSLWKLLFEQ